MECLNDERIKSLNFSYYRVVFLVWVNVEKVYGFDGKWVEIVRSDLNILSFVISNGKIVKVF